MVDVKGIPWCLVHNGGRVLREEKLRPKEVASSIPASLIRQVENEQGLEKSLKLLLPWFQKKSQG